MYAKLTEIQDLEGVQKKCPPKEDQHLKKKKGCHLSIFIFVLLVTKKSLTLNSEF